MQLLLVAASWFPSGSASAGLDGHSLQVPRVGAGLRTHQQRHCLSQPCVRCRDPNWSSETQPRPCVDQIKEKDSLFVQMAKLAGDKSGASRGSSRQKSLPQNKEINSFQRKAERRDEGRKDESQGDGLSPGSHLTESLSLRRTCPLQVSQYNSHPHLPRLEKSAWGVAFGHYSKRILMDALSWAQKFHF